MRNEFLSPLLRPDGPVCLLRNQRTGTVIATHLEAAFESRKRNRGLLGRTGLAPGSALILAPCSSVHTFFMKFTIDVAFVDRNGIVIRAVHTLRPWRIGFGGLAYAAIELPAFTLARTGTQRSDRLCIDQLETVFDA